LRLIDVSLCNEQTIITEMGAMNLQIRDPHARELARRIANGCTNRQPGAEGFTDFGKGRGHPAKLNLADCFSYACAKAQGVALLYKGKDFSHTDLA
jgi:uncharacterized protein with PIN domain